MASPAQRPLPPWMRDYLLGQARRSAMYLSDMPIGFWQRNDGTWFHDVSAYRDDADVVVLINAVTVAKSGYTVENAYVVAAVRVPSDASKECVVLDEFGRASGVTHFAQTPEALDAYYAQVGKGLVAC